MKKKCLTMMAMVFFLAVTMNLQAQDSPNGGTTPGGGNAVNDPLTWNRTGNSQESGTVYNMLGFTNGTPIRFCTNNLNRMYIDANGKIGINTTNPLLFKGCTSWMATFSFRGASLMSLVPPMVPFISAMWLTRANLMASGALNM